MSHHHPLEKWGSQNRWMRRHAILDFCVFWKGLDGWSIPQLHKIGSGHLHRKQKQNFNRKNLKELKFYTYQIWLAENIRDGPWPDPTWAYFSPTENKRLTRLWPRYFWPDPKRFFLTRIKKFDILEEIFDANKRTRRSQTRPTKLFELRTRRENKLIESKLVKWMNSLNEPTHRTMNSSNEPNLIT